MRKVYVLSLLLLTAASGAFAQRSIDWSVDEMVKPVQITTNASGQSTVEVDAIMKLVSGDSAFVGDTVVMVIATNTNPPVQGGFFFLLGKDMGVGDTVSFKNTITINAGVASSINVNFTVASFIRNGSQITAEVAPGNANNQKTKAITWWNKQGWNVSIDETVSNSAFKLSPNPASSEVKVSWNVNKTDATNKITVYDIAGKVVASTEAESGTFNKSLNIESLKAGMYMVEVSNGALKSTQKLQVIR